MRSAPRIGAANAFRLRRIQSVALRAPRLLYCTIACCIGANGLETMRVVARVKGDRGCLTTRR